VVGGFQEVQVSLRGGRRKCDVARKLRLIQHATQSEAGSPHQAAEVEEVVDGAQLPQIALQVGGGVGLPPESPIHRVGEIVRGRRITPASGNVPPLGSRSFVGFGQFQP
jgi:hypothetical protein